MKQRAIQGAPVKIRGPAFEVDAGDGIRLAFRLPTDGVLRQIRIRVGEEAAACSTLTASLKAASADAAADGISDSEREARHVRVAALADEVIAATLRMEAVTGYAMLRLWVDPVWELEARTAYDALAFARQDEPHIAAGRAAIDEIHADTERGVAIAASVVSKIIEATQPAPDPSEVKSDAGFSGPPTASASG